jgi:hypothetical protein
MLHYNWCLWQCMNSPHVGKGDTLVIVSMTTATLSGTFSKSLTLLNESTEEALTVTLHRAALRQWRKQKSDTCTTESYSTTEVRESHPQKASAPIVCTLGGRTTNFKFLHWLNLTSFTSDLNGYIYI